MKLTPTLGGAYSGSFGGLTASRNRGGQYLRRRAMPTNPNTTAQQNVRNSFGQAMTRWSSILTESQRAGWRTYAENVAWTDSLGQSIKLTGAQMYARTNTLIIQATDYSSSPIAVVDDAPTDFTLGPTLVGLTAVGEYDAANPLYTPPSPSFNLQLSWSGSLLDTYYLFVFLGVPHSASRTYYKGPYQLIAAVEGENDSDSSLLIGAPAGVASPYVARYGVPPAGSTINGYVRVLAPNGALGIRTDFECVIEDVTTP